MIEWIDTRYYYLLLMLLSISYPLIRSFENKIRFYKNWKSLTFAITIMMTIFIVWDVIFTTLSVWSFNDRYILGYKFLSLPIEEWMFFICVPYSCIFIHEVLNYFFPIKKIRLNIHSWNYRFALLLIVDNEIKEHRIQDSLSKCLKAKRYAMRGKSANDRVTYQCIKSKANVEIYMGEKKITSLILK